MKQATIPPTSLDFEAAMASLEAIVARIESADLPLDEMIRCYEDGSRLLRQCEERLADARQRVEKIARQSADGVETTEYDAPAGTPAPSTEELF